MNVFVLYLILRKAIVTTFSGLASLPDVREELVLQRHALTDEQLNAAVVITRTTPGPVGLYVVSVGYFAAGIPGAIGGWLAMATPALLILLLLRFIGHRAEIPRLKQTLESVVVASAGLLFASAIPLARQSLTEGAMRTTRLTRRFRRLSRLISPFAWRASICLGDAERNTSTGAPCSICCCKAPEAPKLNTILGESDRSAYAFAMLSIAVVRLDATETVTAVERSAGCAARYTRLINTAAVMAGI